ncbi:MAG: prenyltransferase/squalene oxidase repeat-containing protein [Planctomycetota bacterium]|jgi:hypothetical protein
MNASGLYPLSFEDLMAEQLRRAPWLGLSAFIHGLLAFLLMLWPQERKEDFTKAIQFQPEEPEDPILVPPEKPMESEPELPPEEPMLINPLTETDADDDSHTPSPTAEPNRLDLTELASTGLGLGPGWTGRGGGGPRGRNKSQGGTATIAAIDRGLDWLRNHQDADGRWDADEFMKHDASGVPSDGAGNSMQDVGVTGLALLAYLGDGNHLYAGPYKEQVKQGVGWLRKQQNPESGLIGSRNSADFIYGHAIASYAMVEAYGLSGSRLLRKPAQRAIDYLESHRNRYGAWRYQPQSGDSDSSITGWCLLAYKSAKDFGLQVNDDAMRYGLAWLDDVTDQGSGRTGYLSRGGSSSRRDGLHGEQFPREKGECMTAVALMCGYFLGEDPQQKPIMQRQADLIASKPPVWDEASGSIDHYYWYYGSYALFQAGKKHWRDWSSSLTKAVIKTQRRDQNFSGSWDPVGVWGEDGGRVYSTAILLLTLEAYYRFPKLLVR